ncbi:hypothetical protein DRO_2466 [Deinococcus radiodurans R1 = ATCC 13939 = DSM 20539]|nr:hypothetical protein DRO_2466 [Deinococcus radiodurans R1 = ATCC 13939 = DSM 20539]
MGSANGVLDSKILIALCNDHKTARTIDKNALRF